MEEKLARVDYRTGDRLIILEGVPAGVCRQCGEHYYTAAVAKKMEKLAGEPGPAQGQVIVPVRRYPEVATA
ncbi:MAG: YgiT-type zinc finger protein [Clostridia bacterium]|nr:MAG: YgiT-type zinc finger protein [Clostridia bacterium]